MNSRGRRTQARALSRRLRKARLAVAEKIRREKRRQEKVSGDGR